MNRDMDPIRVTAGLIWNDGLLLLARRCGADPLAGCWEFPGGRIEPGETAEACLEREIREELRIAIRVRRTVDTVRHVYPGKTVDLVFLEADYLDGAVVLAVHDRAEWVAPGDLGRYTLAPADVEFVKRFFTSRAGERGGRARR